MAKEGPKGVVKKSKTKLKLQLNPERANNTEPATILKIQQAAKWLAEGKSRATIKQMLVDKYGMAYSTTDAYYNEAVKALLPEDEEEYLRNLRKANATRLETIYERAMADGDYKNAKDAIAELNKMSGIGREGITVGINTDKANDTQQVIIKFD